MKGKLSSGAPVFVQGGAVAVTGGGTALCQGTGSYPSGTVVSCSGKSEAEHGQAVWGDGGRELMYRATMNFTDGDSAAERTD